jgi:hypothetical protein
VSSGRLGYRSPAEQGRRVTFRPSTRLGTWSVGLAVASIVLLAGWSVMGRLGGVPGLVLGLAAGVVALLAVVRRGERALTVFAALVPFLNVVVFLVVELVVGHD